MAPNCIIQSYEPLKEADPPLLKYIDQDESNETYITLVFSKIKNVQELPEELQQIARGLFVKLPDTCELPPPPGWLDLERVKKGQQFGLKYLYGLSYSQTISLLYLFSTPEGLKPLIFTDKSHTPSLAHKRYLSTILRVQSWYDTEFWDPSTDGYKNLKAVKALHLDVSKRMNRLSAKEVERKTDLEQKVRESGEIGMLCPLQRVLKKDFQSNSSSEIGYCPFKIKSSDRIFFNQLEMSMTQYGFFGLMLTYPEKFGAKNATRQELEDFAHLWRYLGYLLGIRDEYNFCDGDLDMILTRSHQMIDTFMVPMIMNVSKEWEHMARCAYRGIERVTKLRISFEATMMYFCWVLEIPTPNFQEYMSWKERAMFRLTQFTMTEAHRIPGAARIFNYVIMRTLESELKQFKSRKGS